MSRLRKSGHGPFKRVLVKKARIHPPVHGFFFFFTSVSMISRPSDLSCLQTVWSKHQPCLALKSHGSFWHGSIWNIWFLGDTRQRLAGVFIVDSTNQKAVSRLVRWSDDHQYKVLVNSRKKKKKTVPRSLVPRVMRRVLRCKKQVDFFFFKVWGIFAMHK